MLQEQVWAQQWAQAEVLALGLVTASLEVCQAWQGAMDAEVLQRVPVLVQAVAQGTEQLQQHPATEWILVQARQLQALRSTLLVLSHELGPSAPRSSPAASCATRSSDLPSSPF